MDVKRKLQDCKLLSSIVCMTFISIHAYVYIHSTVGWLDVRKNCCRISMKLSGWVRDS